MFEGYNAVPNVECNALQ